MAIHDRVMGEYASGSQESAIQESLAEAHQAMDARHDRQLEAHERTERHHIAVMAKLDVLGDVL